VWRVFDPLFGSPPYREENYKFPSPEREEIENVIENIL